MKAKRKIDQKAIQQFFIDHTEKIVIGLVGLLFVFLTYKAVTLEHYQKTPDALQKATQSATARMAAGPSDPEKSPVVIAPIPPYAEMIEKFKKPIDQSEAATDKDCASWNPQLYAPPRPRDAPTILAIDKLKAVTGRGALLTNQGSSNSASTVGQRWVVVTGLVPYRSQLQEYTDRFKDSASEANMEPHYVGFIVQRAEVTPGSTGQPAWENKIVSCNKEFFAKQFSKWNGEAAEVVDPRLTHVALTSPLPPLANGQWGDDAAYVPDIKILPAAAQANLRGPAGAVPIGGRGAAGGRVAIGGAPRGGGGLGSAIGTGGGSDAGGADETLGSLTDKPKPEQPKDKAADEANKVPEYVLLRYFDFDVESGKAYAYRVFVILQNPNFGLPGSVLVDAELATNKFLGVDSKSAKFDDKGELIWIDTDQRYWSKPCTSTKLPGDMRLLAGPTTPPKIPSPQEFTGEARILIWSEKTGLNQNYSPKELYRGTNLVFKAELKTPGESHRTKVDPLDMKSVLVDLAGGELLVPRDHDRSLTNVGPGAMIVLDESGNLVIHDEMDGHKEWAENTKEPEKPVQNRGSRGQGPTPRITPQSRDTHTDGPDIGGRRGSR